MIRRFLKKLLYPPMIILAAAIIFFEEWVWDHLSAFMAYVAKARVFRWIEARLAKLPPYAAMAVFLIPGLMLLPVKIAALWMMTHGHAGLGVAIIVGAKLLGTAIVVRIFAVCRPALFTIHWFRKTYEWLNRIKTKVYDAIKSSAAWKKAVEWKNAIKRMVRHFLPRPRGGHFSRRWRAIREYLRRRFSKKPKERQN